MKKLIVPSPQKFTCAADYFKTFIKENKTANAFFSFRYFASRIGWPSSYLSDLAKNRKKLSQQRAREFARHFKMDKLELERLIWFSLLEKSDEGVRAIVDQKLTLSPRKVLRPTEKVPDLIQHHVVSEVLCILKFARKKLTATEITRQFAIPGFSLSEIEEALRYIEREKFLSWDKQGNLQSVHRDNPGFDNHNETDHKPYVGIGLHQKYAENFLEFISNPKTPSTYNSGLVELKKDQFMPVALRMIELRNWILELSAENQKDLNPSEPRRLLQMNLDFFSIKK